MINISFGKWFLENDTFTISLFNNSINEAKKLGGEGFLRKDILEHYEKEIKYSQVDRTAYDIDTDFIPFYIYKNSEYRIDKDYGIIKVGTAMYDIIIEDIELVDLIRKCYE